MKESIAYDGKIRDKDSRCANCNGANRETHYSQEHGNWQCFFCYTEWKKITPVKAEKIDAEPIDLMRRLNERLHEKIRTDAIDSQVATLEVHRLYAPEWEQHQITEAINDLRNGLQPDFVPHVLAMREVSEQIDGELEKCREILRRGKA